MCRDLSINWSIGFIKEYANLWNYKDRLKSASLIKPKNIFKWDFWDFVRNPLGKMQLWMVEHFFLHKKVPVLMNHNVWKYHMLWFINSGTFLWRKTCSTIQSCIFPKWLLTKSILYRDVTAGKIWMRPLQWWAESAPPGGDRVKVYENLGATSVAPVAPVDTSLL